MSIGTFEATYSFTADGIRFPSSVVATQGDASICATGDGNRLEVTITLQDVTKRDGINNARVLADATYERLIMQHSGEIVVSASPQAERSCFEADDALHLVHTLHTSAGATIVEGAPLAILDTAIKKALGRALFDLKAPAPSFAAPIATARKMFRVAMETDEPVVSYLVCYTALTLLAVFKSGRDAHGRGPGQAGVDRLLLQEDGTIACAATTRSGGRTVQETVFTRIRNDFIHAEDRGTQDPAQSANEMKLHLTRFRSLTGSILTKG
jgi:hypothetical protein